jgi:hypothetical protein
MCKVILFYDKEKLPHERSECAIRGVKKGYFTNELHAKMFWRPLLNA